MKDDRLPGLSGMLLSAVWYGGLMAICFVWVLWKLSDWVAILWIFGWMGVSLSLSPEQPLKKRVGFAVAGLILGSLGFLLR